MFFKIATLIFVNICFQLYSDEAKFNNKPIKKKIWVIINPISGGINKDNLKSQIIKFLDREKYEIETFYTKAPGHATELSQDALAQQTDIVVAVGGDGTINEIGQALINSSAALGIIPAGSGNGLANHLQIPHDVIEAINLINQGKTISIDTVKINEKRYLGMAGIGFDAEISNDFANFGSRGFFSYAYLTIKRLFKYHRSTYELEIDGGNAKEKAFLIAFANCNQFGNNAYIAPKAKIDDGFIEVVILKKAPLYATPALAIRLFQKRLHHSHYVKTIRCKEIKIKKQNLKMHLDGEPCEFANAIHVQILPSSLKVIVP